MVPSRTLADVTASLASLGAVTTASASLAVVTPPSAKDSVALPTVAPPVRPAPARTAVMSPAPEAQPSTRVSARQTAWAPQYRLESESVTLGTVSRTLAGS